jgi:formiminotetrahydrofolate cyclodeaminase
VDSLEAYSEELASARPTPGGGSAATIVGALGAALVAMVARITSTSPKHAAKATDAASIVVRADRLRAELLSNRSNDERAFDAVIDAQALPRTTDAEKAARTARVQDALANAADVPLRSAELARDVLALSLEALELGNTHLASDAGCGAEFAYAALAGAAYNVRANHAWLHDKTLVESNEARLRALESEAATLLARVRALGSAETQA